MAATTGALLCLCLAPMTEATIFVFVLDCTSPNSRAEGLLRTGFGLDGGPPAPYRIEAL